MINAIQHQTMEDYRTYFKEELGKIAIKLHVDLRRYLDECLQMIMGKKGEGRRTSKEGRVGRRTRGRVGKNIRRGGRSQGRTGSGIENGDEENNLEDDNDSAVGDEKAYESDGSSSVPNLTDGTRSDAEILMDTEEEEENILDAGSRSDSQERLGNDIATHGAYIHYSNGDRDEDDCPPGCGCIACGPKGDHRFVAQPSSRKYTRLEGSYGLDDGVQGYNSDGNTSRAGCSNKSVDDCRTMDVDETNFYLDGGNNSDAGCTDESAGYSSAGGYSSNGSLGHGYSS